MIKNGTFCRDCSKTRTEEQAKLFKNDFENLWQYSYTECGVGRVNVLYDIYCDWNKFPRKSSNEI